MLSHAGTGWRGVPRPQRQKHPIIQHAGKGVWAHGGPRLSPTAPRGGPARVWASLGPGFRSAVSSGARREGAHGEGGESRAAHTIAEGSLPSVSLAPLKGGGCVWSWDKLTGQEDVK